MKKNGSNEKCCQENNTEVETMEARVCNSPEIHLHPPSPRPRSKPHGRGNGCTAGAFRGYGTGDEGSRVLSPK